MLGAAVVFVWQRQCLVGVSYRRQLGRHRALFGEEIPLLVTIENHKAIPLTWLRIEDSLSSPLTIRGGTVATAATDRAAPRARVPPRRHALPAGRAR